MDSFTKKEKKEIMNLPILENLYKSELIIYKYYLSKDARKNSYETNTIKLREDFFKSVKNYMIAKQKHQKNKDSEKEFGALFGMTTIALKDTCFFIYLEPKSYMFIGPKLHPFQNKDSAITDEKIKTYETYLKQNHKKIILPIENKPHLEKQSKIESIINKYFSN